VSLFARLFAGRRPTKDVVAAVAVVVLELHPEQGLYPSRLARELGVDEKTLAHGIAKAQDLGFVELRRGRWALTPDGRRQAAEWRGQAEADARRLQEGADERDRATT